MLPREVQVRDSSNIYGVSFDPETNVMRVAFRGGDVYEYTDVDSEDFGEMVSSRSVGEFFAHAIRPIYDGKKIS